MLPSTYRLPFLFVNEAAYLVSINPPNVPPSSEAQRRGYTRGGSGKEPLFSLWMDFRVRAILLVSSQSAVLFYLTPLMCVQFGFRAFHLCDFLAAVGVLSRILESLGFLPPTATGLPSISHRMHVSATLISGTILSLAGCVIRLVCYRTLGPFYVFQLAIQDDHKLITYGPYSVVRHPAYAGFLLTLFGRFLADFGPGSWWHEVSTTSTASCIALYAIAATYIVHPLFIWMMTVMRVRREDRALKESFGPQWIEWSKRTRFMLLPGIY